MNREPFNIDEDGMFYDVPPTPPHTLTDERAGYGEPSEAAKQLALAIHDSFIRTTDFELSMNRIAMMFDAFAAQQVEAREAEIVELRKTLGEWETNHQRLWSNSRELTSILDDLHERVTGGELLGGYWQGKKDGLRLSLSMLHPYQELEGAWSGIVLSDLDSAHTEAEKAALERTNKSYRKM